MRGFEVISEPGAAIRVEKILLTDEEKEGLTVNTRIAGTVNNKPKIERVWAMPSSETFTIKPIRQLVKWYLSQSTVSVDPFARNNRWATYTNDLNPETQAEFHLDAEAFLQVLIERGVKADLVIFDPPYSTRQIKECYDSFGMALPQERTQGWGNTKELISAILQENGVCISFGWNSIGLGIERGFQIEQIMLVCHGRLHNDTIVTVERKRPEIIGLF